MHHVIATAQTPPVRVLYVNGIQNTPTEALETRRKIAELLLNSANRSGSNKRTFLVSLHYNPKGYGGIEVFSSGCKTLCQDDNELLVLKSAEEDYYPHFKEISKPHNNFVGALSISSAKLVEKYADSLVEGTNSLVAQPNPKVTATQMESTRKVVSSLAEAIKSPTPKIVVAHSQGNILANLAWAKAIATGGQAASSARFVNIANASRFSINGLDLTQADDYVLDKLRQLPILFSFYRTTATQPDGNAFYSFAMAGPTFQRTLPQLCGLPVVCTHTMDTYLSSATLDRELRDQEVEYTNDENSFADRFEDLVYAAANSLDSPPSPSAVIFADDFNRTNSTTIDNGWTEESYYNSGNINAIDTASTLDNRLRITHPFERVNVDGGLYRSIPQSCGVVVSGAVEWMNNLAAASIVGLNTVRSQNQRGLQLVLAPSLTGPHQINLYHEGVPTREPVPFSFSVATQYKFEWTVRQDCSTDVRVWRADQARPSTPIASTLGVTLVQRTNPLLALFAGGGSGCCTYPGYDVRMDDISISRLE